MKEQAMYLEWDPEKELKNKRKHGLDFSFAEQILLHLFVLEIYDRFEEGEHRYHAFAPVGGVLLLVVYAHPDPDREDRVRIIGLRKATPQERKRYEEDDH